MRRVGDLGVSCPCGVAPLSGQGTGKAFVKKLLVLAGQEGKKTVRLDILGTNTAADRLYTGCGVRFVAEKDMFYEDTGLAEYKILEYQI